MKLKTLHLGKGSTPCALKLLSELWKHPLDPHVIVGYTLG